MDLSTSDKMEFSTIIAGIVIVSSRRRVLEMMLPFKHLYHACSGPRLCEFPVGEFPVCLICCFPGSLKIYIFFGHLEVEIGKTEN